MTAVLAALTPIFLVIVLGYALRRARFLPDAAWAPIERLTYYILFPALLLRGAATADLAAHDIGPMVGATAAATLIVAAALIALNRAITPNGPAFTSVFQGSVRFNTYVGLAAAAALYGTPGLTLISIAVAVMVPLANVLCVFVMLRHASAERMGPARLIRALLTNPLIAACLGGIALNVGGIGIPFGLEPLVGILGSASLATGLLAVGAGLDLRALRGDSRNALIAAALKLVVLPSLTAAACRLLGVSGTALGVAILITALPSSASAYVLARQMGGDDRLMAATLTVQTILAAVTIPLALVLFT